MTKGRIQKQETDQIDWRFKESVFVSFLTVLLSWSKPRTADSTSQVGRHKGESRQQGVFDTRIETNAY